MKMEQTDTGGAVISFKLGSAKSVTLKVPADAMAKSGEAFDLASITLKTWGV
jgi:hypothetical protein